MLRLSLLASFILAAIPLIAQTQPDLLLINGKIWTVNPSQPETQAVAITGNHILAVGTNDDILKWKRESSRVIDLHGHRVVPGFNDAHVHFYDGGSNLAGVQLRSAKSPQALRDAIAAFSKTLPPGQWILGGNWDHENWSPANLPTRQLIDPVTPDRPVFVSRLDGHMALANSVALKMAAVDRNTKDIPGGVIVRDENGDPTGVLKDAAQTLVEKVIPAPSANEIARAIDAAQQYAAANGVTSVQDMSAAPDIFRVYQTMLHKGDLNVRISGHQPLANWQQLAQVGLLADFGNPFLHIGGLKGFADGSLGSTTALLFAPYLDSPNTSGITSAALAHPEKMLHDIEQADEAGLQIAVHAIGDKANHIILGFYEETAQKNGPRDRRFRIEHAQHLIPADIPRFGALHVIASMQPYHLMDDGRWAEKRIGPERAKTSYAYRSLLDTGAVLAFGSDWPVAPMIPLQGILGAVTRRTLDGKHPDGWVPEQKITVAEAVKAYTMGSAYASFEDGIKGSIEPGKLADLVVLSDDIFTIDPTRISETHVLATILDGNVIFGSLE